MPWKTKNQVWAVSGSRNVQTVVFGAHPPPIGDNYQGEGEEEEEVEEEEGEEERVEKKDKENRSHPKAIIPIWRANSA